MSPYGVTRTRSSNTTTNPQNNSNVGHAGFYAHDLKLKKTVIEISKNVHCTGFVVATLIFGENKMVGRTLIFAKYMASS